MFCSVVNLWHISAQTIYGSVRLPICVPPNVKLIPTPLHVTRLQRSNAIAEGKVFHLHDMKYLYCMFISLVTFPLAWHIKLQCRGVHCLLACSWTQSQSQSEQMLTHLLSHLLLHERFNQDFFFLFLFFPTLLSSKYWPELWAPLCSFISVCAGANLEWTSIHFESQDKSVIKDAELKIRNSDLYIMP